MEAKNVVSRKIREQKLRGIRIREKNYKNSPNFSESFSFALAIRQNFVHSIISMKRFTNHYFRDNTKQHQCLYSNIY